MQGRGYPKLPGEGAKEDRDSEANSPAWGAPRQARWLPSSRRHGKSPLGPSRRSPVRSSAFSLLVLWRRGHGSERGRWARHSPAPASQPGPHLRCCGMLVATCEPRRAPSLFIPISSVFTQGLPCAPAARPGSHVTFSLLRAMAVSQTCLVLGDLDPFKEDWAGVLENVPQLGPAWRAVGFGRKTVENKPSWMSGLTSG